jgi:hypothetical protein
MTSCEYAPDFSKLPASLYTPGPNPNYGGTLNALSPAAQLMLQKYPYPNQALTNGNNWSASLASPVYWRQENIRGDYNLTKNNTIMGRYTQDSWSNNAYNAGYWGEDPFPALNDNWIQPSKSIVGKWTRTIGTTMVNDVSFTYSNNRINITPGGINPGNGNLYGTALLNAISGAIPVQYPNLKEDPAGIPTLWGGLNAYGSYNNYWSIAPWNNKLDLYVVKDDASKVIGRHTIKFGGQISWNAKDEDVSTSSSERPTFGSADWATNMPTGNDVANLLVPGALWSMSETSTNVRAQLRWHDDALYVSDNFKVTPRLTLDLGLRWDLLDAPYQPNDQITNFQPGLYNPALPASDACNGLWVVAGQDPCGAANAQFGTNFTSGTPGPGRALVNNNNHLFAPRAGIAWDPWGDGNTAIRVGAGRFFQRERVSRYTLVDNAPFAVTAGYTRALDGGSAVLNPGAAPAGGMDPTATVPESWQWNVSVQRSLARDTTLEIGYVGNHAIHQTTSQNLNEIAPQNWLQASFLTAAQQQAADLFPFNNYSSNLAWWSHRGTASYNSLQALFKTRYRRSQLTAAYTWSHSIATPASFTDNSDGGLSNPGGGTFTYGGDPNLDRGNSSINRPHIFTANANYFLPDLNQSNRLVRGALGGWELGLITTEAMGNSLTVWQNSLAENTALTVGGATDNLNSLFATGNVHSERPLVVPGQSCDIRQGNVLLNQNAFTLVGYQIGTIPANTEPWGYCRGSSLLDTDLSIDKNFKLTERFRLQFRLDLFDAFNHPNFRNDQINQTPFVKVNCGAAVGGLYAPCSPTNNIITNQTTNTQFGQSTGQVGNAGRQIQYGLHLTF